MEKKYFNGYYITKEFTNKNSGNGIWTFAQKDGKEYFLKEFLEPVYPIEESVFSKERLKEEMDACERFEKEKEKFYKKINDASDGNIVRIQSFFRCESKYYIAMDKIYGSDYSPMQICNLSFEQQILFCRVLAHSLMNLHQAGIIHADIKWDNMVFTQGKEKKTMTVKLVDFDNSFLIGKQPDCDLMGIDPVYCAPETFKYMNGEPLALDFAIDIYALGIIFHQIFTGSIPSFDKVYGKNNEHRYIFEGLLQGEELVLDARVPLFAEKLVRDMLRLASYERPSAQEVFERLCNLGINGYDTEEIDEKNNENAAGERFDDIDEEELSRDLWIKRHKASKKSEGWFRTPGDIKK